MLSDISWVFFMKNLSRIYPFAALTSLAIAVIVASVPAGESKSPGKIAPVLQPFVDDHSLAGAVTLVATKDKIVSHEAVGFLDIAAKLLMPLNAIFWIASQSKPITAAALMILIDEGKLKLDDPVEKFLPEFRNQMVIVEQGKDRMVLQRPKQPITVRHLLAHTSGMPFSSLLEQPTLDALTLKDAVRSYALTPLNSEPGTKYKYSNAGINTAGRLIEVLSGMSYEDFMDKRLFGPLGMKDTTFWPNDEQLKRLAKGYKPGDKGVGLVETTVAQLTYPLNDRKRQPMPAGGLFSSATDVAKFCQLILNEGEFEGKRILSKSAVLELTKRQTPDTVKESYGLGFTTFNGVYGHGGAWATNMSIDSKRGLVTVWLVQHTGGFPKNGAQAQGAFRKKAEQLFGQ